MKNQRNAIVWMIVSWLVRRWVRQRTARVAAVAGRTTGSGRVRSVVGAVALVAILAGAFVAWRRFAGEPDETSIPNQDDTDLAVGIA